MKAVGKGKEIVNVIIIVFVEQKVKAEQHRVIFGNSRCLWLLEEYIQEPAWLLDDELSSKQLMDSAKASISVSFNETDKIL